jgi:flagellar hook-length control protein FliK
MQTTAQSGAQAALLDSADPAAGTGAKGFLGVIQAMKAAGAPSPEITAPEITVPEAAVPSADGGEGLSGILIPIGARVIDGLNRLEELNELGGEELAERYGPEGAEAIEAMNEAVVAVKDAAVKMSRFDPDVILGEEFAGGELHRALKEFLKKLKGLDAPEDEASDDAAAPDAVIGTDTDTDAEARLDEIPVIVPDDQGVPEAAAGAVSESSPDDQEAPAVSSGERVVSTPPAAEQEPQRTEPDAAGEPLAAAQAANQTPAPAPVESNAADDDIDDIIRAFRDAIASRPDSGADSSGRDPGGSGGDTKDSGFQLNTGREAPSASPAVLRASRQSAASEIKGGGETVRRAGANSFASEVAASMTPRAEAASAAPQAQVQAPLPGSVYTLNPENAFGDGLTNVLEFMKNGQTNEARIVVEPPALGRIDVSLQATASGVEAAFRVDNEHLKQMLQQQLDSLKASLQAQGIHVSGLTVDIKNRDDQKGRGDLYGANKKARRTGEADGSDGGAEAENRLVRLDLERGLLHWVA